MVSPFTVGRTPADEELAYFGPEVARAVTAALESAGIDVGPGGEWPVSGRIESLGGDRVKLMVSARGRILTIDGPLESVDQLAGQLASRLVPILTEGEPVRPGKPTGPPRVVAQPLARPKEAAVASPAPVAVAPIAAPAPVAAPAPPSPPPAPTVTVTPPEPAPTPPKSNSEMPEVLPAYPPSNYHPWGGFVAGRVVAHAIPDPPSTYVGTGVSATQALYGFLGRRLRLAVVPTGVGVTSPTIAADEGWRSSARSVVMARVENVEYLPSSAGISVRLRLQVVVVREGRVVLRRVVDSPMSDPTRRTDPVYQAVTSALEGLVADLAAALQPT